MPNVRHHPSIRALRAHSGRTVRYHSFQTSRFHAKL
jgi:hypothetical protein